MVLGRKIVKLSSDCLTWILFGLFHMRQVLHRDQVIKHVVSVSCLTIVVLRIVVGHCVVDITVLRKRDITVQSSRL